MHAAPRGHHFQPWLMHAQLLDPASALMIILLDLAVPVFKKKIVVAKENACSMHAAYPFNVYVCLERF